MAPKTVAFFGASTGVGLSALKHSLAAGFQCTALCRTASKLTSILPASSNPNLEVIEGNAHDAAAVSRCLRTADGKLVDEIIFSIGGAPTMRGLVPSIDDPDVCKKGMQTILDVITTLRKDGVSGNPYIVAVSTIGTSRFKRDTLLLMIPVYAIFVNHPRKDKIVMENMLAASGEDFTVVRASHLVDGETETEIRVGVEDPKAGVESQAIGFKISREDTGRWIAENLVLEREGKYLKKFVSITY